jgi:hypothetical protein
MQGSPPFNDKFFHGFSYEIKRILRQFSGFAKHITNHLHPLKRSVFGI